MDENSFSIAILILVGIAVVVISVILADVGLRIRRRSCAVGRQEAAIDIDIETADAVANAMGMPIDASRNIDSQVFERMSQRNFGPNPRRLSEIAIESLISERMRTSRLARGVFVQSVYQDDDHLGTMMLRIDLVIRRSGPYEIATFSNYVAGAVAMAMDRTETILGQATTNAQQMAYFAQYADAAHEEREEPVHTTERQPRRIRLKRHEDWQLHTDAEPTVPAV